MAQVYMMCGLSFSGKTTLSKKIAESLKATRISFDELWVELEKDDEYFPSEGGVEGWKYVCLKAEEKIASLLNDGKNVVYDNTNTKKEHRDRIKSIAEKYAAMAIVVYMHVPFDEIKQREKENLTTGERHTVQSDNFKNAVEQFEEPMEDEYTLVYNPKIPIDFWLKMFVTDENVRTLPLYLLGMRNFKKFVEVICYLLLEEHKKFDLIVGSGNSGVVVAKYTELIYKELNIPCPPIIHIPVLRYRGERDREENRFDNSVLLPEIKEKLKDCKLEKLTNVLFVDDEIGLGITAKTCLELLIQATNAHNITYTVVAEDQGVSWGKDLPSKIEFYPFAQEWPGLNNVILWFMPGNISHPIEAMSDEIKGSHSVMNIILGLPIKEKGTDIQVPSFTEKYNQIALERVPNLPTLREEAINIIHEFIVQGINDYKDARKQTKEDLKKFVE